jgi:phospholipase/carboxylesterase
MSATAKNLDALDAFQHIHVPARRAGLPPLLLLHGTGGDEHDLIPLGERILPGAAILSPRGPVLESGMPRFFRRFAEGRFDIADVHHRADDLAAFIAAAQARYGLTQPVAVGFSNGANIAAAVLLKHPGLLAGAVLLRAMHPFHGAAVSERPATRAGTPVLLLSGRADPIVPSADRESLVGALTKAGARVSHEVLPAGHGLTGDDVTLAQAFVARLNASAT